VLFDVNGSFGKKCSGKAEFPTIQERLDFMNRFGISRSLVWNDESVQHHALSCNQRLIEEIRKTPGARGRIVPALTVSGLMPYEHAGVEELTGQMKSMNTRALRFVSVFGRLTLCQLEPVIRKIRSQKPFIVLRHDQSNVQDILEFAAMFPDIPLILTEVMWCPGITVFDLMRRRRNIMMDNSWHHTAGGIEQVVKHFGADRLVFGSGLKSHNGAAIGALARADITESDRKKIAFGNLDRLMGSKTNPISVASTRNLGNTLWPRFLEGKSLDVDIVDAHGHLGPSAGYVVEAQEERQQAAAALKAMKAVGMRTMIVSGLQALLGATVEGNALLEDVLRPNTGRFLGYVAFNPLYADDIIPRFDRYFSGRFFVGFKTLCGYWGIPITDPRFNPMWAYANRHHLPVLSHTWEGPHNSPAQFKDIVKRYPNVSFILGHSGGGDSGRREAEALAQTHRNVYLEWCGSFCSSVQWEQTLRVIPSRQILFGTDAMAHEINWELARLLSLDVSDKVLIPILGGNMRRILAMRRR
jgi:predicted TIM-barrel fold metal-dependent hydrolase